MLAKIKLLYETIRLFWTTFKFIRGKIREEIYISRIREIKEATEKAGKGKLEDRLDAGKDVEDFYNRNAD